MSNISKEKRDNLIQKLENLKAENINNEDLIKTINETINELNSKKYGLVWEEHSERVDEELKTKYPIFSEVKEKEIHETDSFDYNFLLEGDNLHSLKLLQKTHKGKIDVIYIDPPYNTGNKDFIYDDNFIKMDDGYRHSKWLSFMHKRLILAKELLSENGAIFINIDDNEQAELKLLCDTVFGESNFITTIPWHNRTSIQNDTDISVNHEYILVYAKYKRNDNRRLKKSNKDKWDELVGFTFLPKETDKSKFSNPDNDIRGLWKADPFDAPHIRPNLTYPIINPNTGEQHLPPRGRHWRISQEKFASALKDNRIIFGKNGKGRPQLKVFYNEVKFKGSVADTWFDSHIFGTSTNGKKELLKLLPDSKEIFSTPKPVNLYIELMKLSVKNKDAIILDFFAGSGTTAQAVLELNKEDGGNRKFILCTNNENNICEDITYQRIKTVITGKKIDGSDYENNVPSNLKYYKTDYVMRDNINDEDYVASDELLDHVTEMVQLEHHIKIDKNKYIILLSDEDAEEFVSQIDKYNPEIIYLEETVFLPESIMNKLRNQGVKFVSIPDYYFDL